jgi:hemolysin III
MVVFMLLLGAPFKALFPTQPVILALLISVTLYYCFYEVWHAILHLPYERFWRPMIEARWNKGLFKRMYSFHLMHHWRPTSNLAVVGFWGIALWDHVFRTHRRPERLPVDGSAVNYHDAKLNQPIWPISAIDRAQAKLYKGSRAIEKQFARLFLRRNRDRA